MAAKYWIKLYHEMLHDRKSASLDDHLWRRSVECFLMAGEQDEGGFLPPLEDMAWTLRADIEQLETDLTELIRVGILEFRDGRYFVKNFAKRQAKMPKAEYMRRLREERKQEIYYPDDKDGLPSGYQPVTDGNTEKRRGDTDTEEEEEIDFGKVCKTYEENIGALTPLISEQIGDDFDEYGGRWCVEAIKKANRMNKNSWAYCQGILRGWKRDGFTTQSKAESATPLDGYTYLGE